MSLHEPPLFACVPPWSQIVLKGNDVTGPGSVDTGKQSLDESFHTALPTICIEEFRRRKLS